MKREAPRDEPLGAGDRKRLFFGNPCVRTQEPLQEACGSGRRAPAKPGKPGPRLALDRRTILELLERALSQHYLGVSGVESDR